MAHARTAGEKRASPMYSGGLKLSELQ